MLMPPARTDLVEDECMMWSRCAMLMPLCLTLAGWWQAGDDLIELGHFFSLPLLSSRL